MKSDQSVGGGPGLLPFGCHVTYAFTDETYKQNDQEFISGTLESQPDTGLMMGTSNALEYLSLGNAKAGLVGELVMQFWTPRRMTAFLTIWTLVIPLKVNMVLPRGSWYIQTIYAGLWAYVPGNPFYSSDLVFDVLYTSFMIPFWFPGIAVAWFVWHSFTDRNMTRRRYFEIVVTIQVIHLLILWYVFPCPISLTPHLCIPTSVTGLLALPFVSRIVKVIDSPWADRGNYD